MCQTCSRKSAKSSDCESSDRKHTGTAAPFRQARHDCPRTDDSAVGNLAEVLEDRERALSIVSSQSGEYMIGLGNLLHEAVLDRLLALEIARSPRGLFTSAQLVPTSRRRAFRGIWRRTMMQFLPISTPVPIVAASTTDPAPIVTRSPIFIG